MRSIIVAGASLILLVSPGAALACSLAGEEPLRPHISRAELRTMHRHEGVRGAWVRDHSWKSFPVRIRQRVQLDGMDEPVTAAFRQQRSIPLIAVHPQIVAYHEDDDPATTCAVAGQRSWSTPKLLVHETGRAIFITLVMRETAQGSTDGCAVSVNSCENLALRTITLEAPIGDRQLYATTFA